MHRETVSTVISKFLYNHISGRVHLLIIHILLQALHYLRCCLAQSSGVQVKKKTLLSHPCESSPLIGRYLTSLNQSDSFVLDSYLSFIDKSTNPSSILAPLQSLEEVVGCCPELLASKYSDKLPTFLVSPAKLLI